MDPMRTSLRVSRVGASSPVMQAADTGPRLLRAQIHDAVESVTVLVDEAATLDGWQVQFRPPSDEADWAEWYTFGTVGQRAAGRRLRVLSESGPDPVPDRGLAGEEDLFRGEPAAFPAEGVDLRLVDPAGHAGHTRRFRPGTAFAHLPDARVLRSADATAFAVLPPDAGGPTGASLPSGSYRLRLHYRRDSRDAQPDAPVLTQAGDDGDEEALLDIDIT
jgi:hypothetical protein